MKRSLRWTMAVATLTFAACSSDAISPEATLRAPDAPTMALAAGGAAGHLVVLKNRNAASSVSAQVKELGGTVRYMHAEVGIALVDGLDDASAAKLAKNAGTQEVMRDQEFTLAAPKATVQAISDVAITSVENPASANVFSRQWNMRLIEADAAWAAGKLGSPGVTVAILDTGIDYDNFDLAGLVDLSRSRSFVPGDDALTAAFFPTRHVIDDYNGHGTNVASQVSSNATWLAGVTSKTTLIGVKVLGRSGSGTTGGVLAGLLWAADNGADVANMSLGNVFAKSEAKGFGSVINKVFNYARQQGMLVVVAAGNAATDLQGNKDAFAAYCDAPHVICVSAVGPKTAMLNQDEPTYYTNFGRGAIAVSAPGGNADEANGFPASARPWGNDVASWVWSLCARRTLVLQNNQYFLTICSTPGVWAGAYIGTSQAAPHVAGLAASLFAEGMNASSVKQAIVKSADKVGGNGTTAHHGSGRINVKKAHGL